MQRAGHGQREGGNLRLEPLPVVQPQAIFALHHASGRGDDGGAGIAEGLAGFEPRCFTHHAFAPDLLDLTLGVGNHPVPLQQTCG